MFSLRIPAAVISTTIIASLAFLAFSPLVSFAADSSAMAKASYLPDELMQLPHQFVIAKEWSGYWAGEDAPLVRCIQVNRPWTPTEDSNEIAPEDLEPLELLPGINLDLASEGALLFYYLDGNGAWIRIGSSVHWYYGIKVSFVEASLMIVSAGMSGNLRAYQNIYAYRFKQDKAGAIALRDMTISIEDMPIVSTYQAYPHSELCYVAYPIMGVNWEGYGPFSHANSPDRYILLAQNVDGTVANISANHEDYYLKDINETSDYFKRQRASWVSYQREYRSFLPEIKDEAYMSYAVTLLIRYHDMGKHDEGIRLARQVIKPQYFSSRERYRYAIRLVNETIADLKMQDVLIKIAIDNYNSELSAKYW